VYASDETDGVLFRIRRCGDATNRVGIRNVCSTNTAETGRNYRFSHAFRYRSKFLRDARCTRESVSHNGVISPRSFVRSLSVCVCVLEFRFCLYIYIYIVRYRAVAGHGTKPAAPKFQLTVVVVHRDDVYTQVYLYEYAAAKCEIRQTFITSTPSSFPRGNYSTASCGVYVSYFYEPNYFSLRTHESKRCHTPLDLPTVSTRSPRSINNDE